MCTMGADEHSSVDDQSLSLRQILDSSPALIHTARPDGYLDFFNRTWLRIRWAAGGKAVGMEMDFLYSSGRCRELLCRSGESRSPRESASRERRECGGLMVSIAGCFIRKSRCATTDGRIIKWHGSSIDIEGRKRAEGQLRKSAEELQTNEFYLTEAQRLGQMGSWFFDPAEGFRLLVA